MINLLYYKFSEMILESSSLEKLEKTIAEKFSDSLSQDLPELSKFKNNIAAQIHFLSLKNFFTFYYEKSELADKYDFVKDFYDQFKKNKEELPVESKAILSYLFYLIVETAWKPVKSQKFNLMDLPDGTVRKVFDDLDVWVKLHYVSFQNRMLFKEIAIKLQKEKHQFKLWEEASHRLFDTAATYRTYEPLMRDLYTMQYCNIQETPEKLLEKLPAPVLFFDYVKPKKQPCHQPICVKKTARCGLDFLVSYLCQEGELFFDESEKNNQEKTHQGFSA